MTVDELPEPSGAAPPAPRPPATPPPDAAIARYRALIRPWRIRYAALIAAAVVAAAVVVYIAWMRGEAGHADLRTVASAPPAVALQRPSATLIQAWTSNDRTTIGTPYWNGTVVTHDQHAVRGRNATTGSVTWSYTRTDRTLCQAVQVQGVTLALFEVSGNCDELTALDSGTGVRKWTRTLDKDGKPLNGHPTYAVADSTVMLTTPSVIYAIDPGSGYDRWVFTEHGCTVRNAVLGTAGALISQSCAKRECSGVKFCGDGQQLLLRDAFKGENTDSSTNKGNPDQIRWNLLGNAGTPTSADAVVSIIDRASRTLDVLDPNSGKTQHRLPLDGVGPAADTIALSTLRGELIWTAGRTYAIDQNGAGFLWKAATPALPTLTAGGGAANPGAVLLAVPTGAGIALLDPARGSARSTFAVGAPPESSRVYPFGTGFVVAGPVTTVYR